MTQKTDKNEMYLTFPSNSRNEAFARTAAAAFLIPDDPTLEELADIRTAVSEAVTNCIVHGYPDREGQVWMHCCLEDRTVTITVEDHGIGIEDIEKARTPMYTTGGEERSGLGFTIMERFMDSVEVASSPGNGTTVIMRKKLCRQEM